VLSVPVSRKPLYLLQRTYVVGRRVAFLSGWFAMVAEIGVHRYARRGIETIRFARDSTQNRVGHRPKPKSHAKGAANIGDHAVGSTRRSCRGNADCATLRLAHKPHAGRVGLAVRDGLEGPTDAVILWGMAMASSPQCLFVPVAVPNADSLAGIAGDGNRRPPPLGCACDVRASRSHFPGLAVATHLGTVVWTRSFALS
jgi:hypothetical protein